MMRNGRLLILTIIGMVFLFSAQCIGSEGSKANINFKVTNIG